MLFENSLRPHEAMNQYDFSTLNGILYEHCEGTARKNRYIFFLFGFLLLLLSYFRSLQHEFDEEQETQETE